MSSTSTDQGTAPVERTKRPRTPMALDELVMRAMRRRHCHRGFLRTVAAQPAMADVYERSARKLRARSQGQGDSSTTSTDTGAPRCMTINTRSLCSVGSGADMHTLKTFKVALNMGSVRFSVEYETVPFCLVVTRVMSHWTDTLLVKGREVELMCRWMRCPDTSQWADLLQLGEVRQDDLRGAGRVVLAMFRNSMWGRAVKEYEASHPDYHIPGSSRRVTIHDKVIRESSIMNRVIMPLIRTACFKHNMPTEPLDRWMRTGDGRTLTVAEDLK